MNNLAEILFLNDSFVKRIQIFRHLLFAQQNILHIEIPLNFQDRKEYFVNGTQIQKLSYNFKLKKLKLLPRK